MPFNSEKVTQFFLVPETSDDSLELLPLIWLRCCFFFIRTIDKQPKKWLSRKFQSKDYYNKNIINWVVFKKIYTKYIKKSSPVHHTEKDEHSEKYV